MKEWKQYSFYSDIPENPPNNVLVEGMGHDYMGTFYVRIKRLDYKIPIKGRSWRWVFENGEIVDRKALPEKWREIE